MFIIVKYNKTQSHNSIYEKEQRQYAAIVKIINKVEYEFFGIFIYTTLISNSFKRIFYGYFLNDYDTLLLLTMHKLVFALRKISHIKFKSCNYIKRVNMEEGK